MRTRIRGSLSAILRPNQISASQADKEALAAFAQGTELEFGARGVAFGRSNTP